MKEYVNPKPFPRVVIFLGKVGSLKQAAFLSLAIGIVLEQDRFRQVSNKFRFLNVLVQGKLYTRMVLFHYTGFIPPDFKRFMEEKEYFLITNPHELEGLLVLFNKM